MSKILFVLALISITQAHAADKIIVQKAKVDLDRDGRADLVEYVSYGESGKETNLLKVSLSSERPRVRKYANLIPNFPQISAHSCRGSDFDFSAGLDKKTGQAAVNFDRTIGDLDRNTCGYIEATKFKIVFEKGDLRFLTVISGTAHAKGGDPGWPYSESSVAFSAKCVSPSLAEVQERGLPDCALKQIDHYIFNFWDKRRQ